LRFSEKKILLAILIFGLALRLLWLVFDDENFIANSDDYDLVARNLLSGKGYTIHPPKPTGERMPIYPFFLASIYKLFGRNIPLVCVMQAFIDMATCFFIYKIANLVCKSSDVALCTAFIYAIYVPYFSMVGVIMNEIIFSLAFSIFVYFYLKSYKTLTPKNSFLLGFLLIFATMIREASFALILLLLLTPYISGYSLKKCLKANLFMILGFSILYAPWFARNLIVFDKVVIISTHAGYTLCCNYFVPDMSKGEPVGILEPEIQEMFADKSEVERDRELLRRAKSYVIKYPYKSLKTFLNNFFVFWFNSKYFKEQRYIRFYPVGEKLFSVSYTVLLFNGILLLSGILGILKMGEKWRREYTILVIIIGYFTILHMLCVCFIRYSMPVIPYVMVFSSCFFVTMYHRYSKRREST